MVSLIHFPLQEYLWARRDFFGEARSAMPATCSCYTNSQQVKVPSIIPSPDLNEKHLLKYSFVQYLVFRCPKFL